jgi:hypothetical protein
VRELFRIEDPGGAVVAQLGVAEADFWLGSVRMVMVVQDPDAAFEQAVKAGASVVRR